MGKVFFVSRILQEFKMIMHVVILREAETLGSIYVAKGFRTLEKAKEFAKDLIKVYTTDETQIKFIEDSIRVPVEFVSDDHRIWQIEIAEVSCEE